MDKFLNNMELITGTIKELEVINKKSKIKTTDGEGKVVALDVLNKKYTVNIDGDRKDYEV